MLDKIFGTKNNNSHIQESTNLPQLPLVTTLRLPVFCRDNKPFVFIKVMNNSEKYRLSVNPEFLKNYNLNFKILRDDSLNSFLSSLKPHCRGLIRKGVISETENDSFSNVSIYLRLPEREKLSIQKHTMLLEHDNNPGRTLIDKYQFLHEDKQTVIYIIERSYLGKRNVSITFVSENFKNIADFLDWYINNAFTI